MIGFINIFLSYGLLLVIIAVLVVAAVIIGKKLRDNKDAKMLIESSDAEKNN